MMKHGLQCALASVFYPQWKFHSLWGSACALQRDTIVFRSNHTQLWVVLQSNLPQNSKLKLLPQWKDNPVLSWRHVFLMHKLLWIVANFNQIDFLFLWAIRSILIYDDPSKLLKGCEMFRPWFTIAISLWVSMAE